MTFGIDMEDMVEGDLATLAEMYGIALEYIDQAGERKVIDSETVVAVLQALDVPVETPADISRAIEERELRDWRRALPPVYQVVTTRYWSIAWKRHRQTLSKLDCFCLTLI